MANYRVKSNNIIKINRGDYYKYPVLLSIGNNPWSSTWEMDGDDILFFGVMEPNQPFEQALIKKQVTASDYDSEGNLFIKFYPEDTVDLIPGTYYYQIKVLYKIEGDEDIHIDTVIDKTKFIVLD